MIFEVQLTEHGKQIYQGANKEILDQALITFEATNQRKAESKFSAHLDRTLGSASEHLFITTPKKRGTTR